MITVIVRRVQYDCGIRITLKFPYDREIVDLIKKLPDARWSVRLQCWHIAEVENIESLLLKMLSRNAFVDYSALRKHDHLGEVRNIRNEIEQNGFVRRQQQTQSSPPPIQEISGNQKEPVSLLQISPRAEEDIKKYRLWLESHRYPPNTVRTYTSMMTTFLKFVAPKEANECDADDLIRMVNDYILPKRLSYAFQNQLISAVKKFYKEICRENIDPSTFTRPRPRHRLPNVLSKEEVRKILAAPVSEKHRVILSLIYGCGLRRSEVLMLEPDDISRDRMLLTIRQSKGFKDRIVPLSPKLIMMIDNYLQHYSPAVYLFEGQYKGNPYSTTSVDKIFRAACQKAGIKRDITLHGLRHSYATHLLEGGTDLRYIQELLGHKNSKTTEIYTHVTQNSIQKIRSPFDDL